MGSTLGQLAQGARSSFAMLHFTVTLPSGRSVNLSLPQSSKVGDLKTLTQESLGLERQLLQLVTADGQVLTDHTKPLQDAGLQDGDLLMVIAGHAKLAATRKAFALFCKDQGVTWGDRKSGGDSSAVQDQLRSVQQVQATSRAFAAILEDGFVVTWGDPDRGGDSSEVQHQLQSVQQIQATIEAFAAILADGSVVTWGKPLYGGDSSAVQDQLKSVQQIQATGTAFAAILRDGSVATWGDPDDGGDIDCQQKDQVSSSILSL